MVVGRGGRGSNGSARRARGGAGRGRGRGGVGRGRGRGRGGVGRRRGRGGASRERGRANFESPRENAGQQEGFLGLATNIDGMPFDIKVRCIFLGKSEFKQHVELQEENAQRYFAVLTLLFQKKLNVLQVAKTKALAAAWSRKDYSLANAMLAMEEEKFYINEVLKAFSLMDSARAKRAAEKKYKRLEAQGCKKKKLMGNLKALIGNLTSETEECRAPVTGGIVKSIKKWTRSLPPERLEFVALHFPGDPWKKLADLCHFHPDKDFPQCKWFLPHCFGKEAPHGTIVGDTGVLTADNISDMVMKHDIDYTVVRKLNGTLTDEAKTRIAIYTEKLDTLLWYYEELNCPSVDEIIVSRLRKDELTMSYGKLMERLTMLYFRNGDTDFENKEDSCPFLKHLIPIANQRLQKTRLSMESPVVVIGDMSGSMDVAIRTSNIIASVLSAINDAELIFFDFEVVEPPFSPTTVEDVFKLSTTIKARGCTCPAIALNKYYNKKQVVKTFIIVTDEMENQRCNNLWFHELFTKYYEEVFPAKLVFISFHDIQHVEGQMVSKLRFLPDNKLLHFRFNYDRPDLTKLDSILGYLSLDTDDFHREVDEVEKNFGVEIITKKINKTTV